MKQFIASILLLFIYISCVSTAPISEINHFRKGTKGFQLKQSSKAHSSEKIDNALINQFFNIQSTYLFKERNNQNPEVTLKFHGEAPFDTNLPDSVMFVNLDNENIRIVSSSDQSKMNDKQQTSANGLKMLEYQMVVPENLWLSIANSNHIIYRLSFGKIGIEINPDQAETIQVKEFFNRAMQRRLKIIPLVPPGKKKW